jgi:hypothetical protein
LKKEGNKTNPKPKSITTQTAAPHPSQPTHRLSFPAQAFLFPFQPLPPPRLELFFFSQNQKSHRPLLPLVSPPRPIQTRPQLPPSQPPPTEETSGGRQQQRPQAPSPSSSARAARLLQPAATTRSAVRGLHSVRRSFLLCSFSHSRLC